MCSSVVMLIFFLCHHGLTNLPSEKFVICSIVQNEADTISEWLAYHHDILGIHEFILYDDGSSDETRAAAAAYDVQWVSWDEHAAESIFLETVNQAVWDPDGVPRDVHEVFANPQKKWFAFGAKQYFANRHCLRSRLRKTAAPSWIALIDVDEYIVPREISADGLRKDLSSSTGCDFMNFRMFGTSGVLTMPRGALRTSQLHLRKKGFEGNGKSFVHSSAFREDVGPHTFARAIHKFSTGLLKRECRDSPIELFHYHTGTIEDLVRRRGRAALSSPYFVSFNAVHDGRLQGISTIIYDHLLRDSYWVSRHPEASRRLTQARIQSRDAPPRRPPMNLTRNLRIPSQILISK